MSEPHATVTASVRYALVVLARLPAWSLEPFAAVLAGVFYLLPNRRRRTARANLDLIASAAPWPGHRHLLLHHLHYRARALCQVGRLLYAPLAELFAEITEIAGLERLTRQDTTGRGVLMIAPHLGYWELFSLYLSAQVKAAILYRPGSTPAAESLLRACRGRAGVEMLPATAGGVRRAFKRLAAGGIVGLLPDQKPGKGQAVTVNFLGRPTAISPLAARLVRQTNCRLLAGACVRRGRGYRLEIDEIILPHAAANYAALGDQSIMTAVFGSIEKLIALAPAEYQWSYRLWLDPQAKTAGGLSS